ncbi:cohesin domain-containing protein [Metabacillus litoralis]|uniref:cohesin domain-containing protein n=1 Tax=Metabacillus litoralis TaxID=152268 RepID=UPI001CFC955A|nr:cohesin domain-containing protein [Metabacillus litoralis]
MKTKLKLIGQSILALLIILNMLPIQPIAASEQTDAVLSIGNISGEVGQVVEVPVHLNTSKKDIAAYGMELNYDKESLEVIGVKDIYGSLADNCSKNDTGCFWFDFSNNKGHLRTAWADTSAGDYPLDQNKKLFTIQFKIKEVKEFGEKAITIPTENKEALSFTDSSNRQLTVNVEQGKLTINKSSNAQLKSLLISDGSLKPSFTSDVTKYSTTVDQTVKNISFVPTTESAKATVSINGKTVKNGTLSSAYPLSVGANEFEISITAEDGSTKKYKSIVTRNKAKNPEDSKTDVITVDIESKGNSVVSKTPIERTTYSNGVIKDYITFSEDAVKETIDNLKKQDSDTAKIIVPDNDDNVTEIFFSIPVEGTKLLANSNINLEIIAKNFQITVPTSSLEDLNEDLYFRFVPVKSNEEKQQIQSRAENEEIISTLIDNKSMTILGRPLEIHTNMKSKQVTITLPFENSLINSLLEEDQSLDNLYIFIEHDDGTKEIIKGKKTAFNEKGFTGYEFQINKFSTFTPIYVSEKGETTNNEEVGVVESDQPVKDSENNNEKVIEESASPVEKSSLTKLPKTGDDSYIDLYLNIAIAGVVAILVFVWRRKRRAE